MVRREEKLPSDKDKQIDDGTLGLEICHQGKKSEFAMAYRPENVPSDNRKQVCDSTPDEKCCGNNIRDASFLVFSACKEQTVVHMGERME